MKYGPMRPYRGMDQGCAEDIAKDARRYQWLRDKLQNAKAGGAVEVNQELQYYEQPTPGEQVRIYWYPNNPVGHHRSVGVTLDDAIDKAMAEDEEELEGCDGK